MSDRPLFRRRQLVVRPGFQYRFMAMLLVEMGAIVAILGLLAHRHVERVQGIAARVSGAMDPNLASVRLALDTMVRNFYTWSLVLAAATLVLLVLCGLLASHKLAGPVFKLTRYFDAIASGGDPGRIAFRRKDRLDAFAADVNQAVDALAARRQEVSSSLAALKHKASDLQETRSTDDARRILDEIEELVSRLTATVEVEGHS